MSSFARTYSELPDRIRNVLDDLDSKGQIDHDDDNMMKIVSYEKDGSIHTISVIRNDRKETVIVNTRKRKSPVTVTWDEADGYDRNAKPSARTRKKKAGNGDVLEEAIENTVFPFNIALPVRMYESVTSIAMGAIASESRKVGDKMVLRISNIDEMRKFVESLKDDGSKVSDVILNGIINGYLKRKEPK